MSLLKGKMEKKLKIEKSKYPTKEATHVLWLETNTPRGINYRGIFHGTHQQCLEEKEKLEKGDKDVSKPKFTSFRLLAKAFHNR